MRWNGWKNILKHILFLPVYRKDGVWLIKLLRPVCHASFQRFTPTRKYDNYKRPYQNPGLLHEAGVELAITADNNVENVRNLLYNAGYAAAYGLGKEEALKAVTINTAEIFGVDDLLGS